MTREVRLRLELEDYRCKPRIVEVVLTEVEGYGEHRGRKLKAYEVYEQLPKGQALVGRVTEHTETLERSTKGRRYVNRRWTGAATVWRAVSASTGGREHRMNRRTRQDAVAVLFGMSRARRVKSDA
jgi:hypothetical protein